MLRLLRWLQGSIAMWFPASDRRRSSRSLRMCTTMRNDGVAKSISIAQISALHFDDSRAMDLMVVDACLKGYDDTVRSTGC